MPQLRRTLRLEVSVAALFLDCVPSSTGSRSEARRAGEDGLRKAARKAKLVSKEGAPRLDDDDNDGGQVYTPSDEHGERKIELE